MNFTDLMQQGAGHAWLYIPAAILLGALHGLEPGHSKTMMAAFIIAIRGTISQAVLLGLSAALSHSLVIWALAALALKFGDKWSAEKTEPYFQLASAVIILAMATWMFFRTRRDAKAEAEHHHPHHGHDHHHGHGHSHDGGKVINDGHGGAIAVEIFEENVPPVFRLRFSKSGRTFIPDPSDADICLIRPDGSSENFSFAAGDGFLQSTIPVPEPHEFEARLTLRHGDHSHGYKVCFTEHDHNHDHGHHHDHDHHHDLGDEFQDAHEAAHAADIERRFAGRTVTTWQIILFGLTGGLMPCPAALTVLVVCLQVKAYSLGFALVAAFSFGLALVMVTVGAAAAYGVRHAEKKMKGFNKLMRRAPYASCALLVVIALYMAWHGWTGLTAHP